MNWEVKIAKRVSKGTRKIPKKDAERLLIVLQELEINPYQGDIQKIKGEDNVWRKRIGNYRILYEIKPEKRRIEIYQIRRRTTATYRRKIK